MEESKMCNVILTSRLLISHWRKEIGTQGLSYFPRTNLKRATLVECFRLHVREYTTKQGINSVLYKCSYMNL